MCILYHLKFREVYRGPFVVDCSKHPMKRLLKYLHLTSRGHFTHLYIASEANADDAETQGFTQYQERALQIFFLKFTKI